MSSRFYFGDSGTESDNDDNDASTLPFPKPLAREAFLTATFDAADFLSNLSGRFQTLEDLQTELRELSQSLNKELVDLVNDNYQDFLTLGGTLRGGDEKVEDIRVGLLGFQRDIADLKSKLDARRDEVCTLVDEKREALKDAEQGRQLLQVAERLEHIERRLGLFQRINGSTRKGNTGDGGEENLSSDSEDEATDEDGTSLRSRESVEQYLILKLLLSKHASNHPFIVAQQNRINQVKATMLLELDTMSKQAQTDAARQELLGLRRTVGEN